MTAPPHSSLPAPLEELLRTEESPLAALAAAGLDGLRGTLRAALDALPSDKGAPACAALLDDLDRLLAEKGSRGAGVVPPAGTRVPPVPVVPPRPVVSPVRELAQELAVSAEVADFAPGAVPPGPEEANAEERVRRWFHLTLLRLPDRHAAVWRDRAAAVVPAPAAESWRELAGWSDEVLLPPAGDGRPGLRTVRAKSLEPADLTALVLALADYDEALCLLLDKVYTGGSERLADPAVLRAYQGELTRRLDLLGRSTPDSTARLRAAVAVDEAVCSVTHLPPGAPDSWWHRLARESHTASLDLSRRLRAAGRNVETVLPARPYGRARAHTQGDDVRLLLGGRPGDTLTCLRLWLRVDDQVFPGRVVHRGLE